MLNEVEKIPIQERSIGDISKLALFSRDGNDVELQARTVPVSKKLHAATIAAINYHLFICYCLF